MLTHRLDVLERVVHRSLSDPVADPSAAAFDLTVADLRDPITSVVEAR